MEEGVLSLMIDSHIVTWNGSATYNIYYTGGHGEHEVHVATIYEKYKEIDGVEKLRKNMTEIYWSYCYGEG